MDCVHGKQDFWYGYYDEKDKEDEKRITDISAMIEVIVCRKPDMVKSSFCQKITENVYLTIKNVEFFRGWEDCKRKNEDGKIVDSSRIITESKLLYVLFPEEESSKRGWIEIKNNYSLYHRRPETYYPDSSILAPVLKALKDNFCFEHYKETV
jgi:hypothetical protein